MKKIKRTQHSFIADKERNSTKKQIWDVSPIVCFATDKNEELAFQVMLAPVQKKMKNIKVYTNELERKSRLSLVIKVLKSDSPCKSEQLNMIN